MTSKTVLIAMSGGVDSSVTAALLQQQGYRCQGVYMRLGTAAEITGLTPPDKDPTPSSADDALAVAQQLGIELTILDFRQDLRDIVNYFVTEYRNARTPNPCVRCNRLLKFGRLLEHARTIGADYLATGHYARIINTPVPRLCRARQIDKDQSYVLYGMGAENQSRVLLPLGDYTKPQVRQMAADMQLHVHDKGESQEICFIPDDNYVGLIEQLAPELAQSGDVRHVDGRLLGSHNGIFRYTIGQRRGLGIALGEPAYVVKLDAPTNTVWLGSRDDLAQCELTADQMIWLTDTVPQTTFPATVQIRYNHRGAAAQVTPIIDQHGHNSSIRVIFNEPTFAVTPGQSAVIYDNDGFVIAGGIIITGT